MEFLAAGRPGRWVALAVSLALAHASAASVFRPTPGRLAPATTDGVVALAVPGRANATPSMAAVGSLVAVVWSAADSAGATDIYAAVSRNSGRAFGAPVRVNDVPGDARVNGEQPPHVAIHQGAQTVITVVWTTKGVKGTTLMQSRSDDGGRSFAHATLVPGTDAPGNRGWEAIASERSGRVDAVWLDHRGLALDTSMETSHRAHAAAGGSKPDGVAMAQKSRLYFAPLDGSASPTAITGGVCYCCKTALASGSDGSIYAAWRHVYPGNLRDMAFTLSRDGGRTFASPIRVSEDKWMLEGCPDDGPAMALDGQNRVHLAWPTLVAGSDGAEANIGIFYASSADARKFSARERLPTEGTPHHPRVTVTGGALVVAWDELHDGARRIVVAQRPLAATKGSFARQVVSDDTPGIYPVVVSAQDGVLVAWTSGAPKSAIRVTRLPAGASGADR